jgi:hypothetical protein
MRALRELLVAAVVVAALACVPAAADITMCQTFTNNTVHDSVNDLHLTFNPYTLTDNAWDGGVFSQLNDNNKSEGANTIEYCFSGGNVAKGNQTTVSITFDQNGYGQGQTLWSINGAPAGQAGAPFSLRGSPGTTADYWVVALDNRDIQTTFQLIVSNLQFAVSSTVYNAHTLQGATFAWFEPVVSTFEITSGGELEFLVPTGPGEYPVLQATLMDAGMSETLSSFRAQITPEPATMALLGLGVASLVARRRNKK